MSKKTTIQEIEELLEIFIKGLEALLRNPNDEQIKELNKENMAEFYDMNKDRDGWWEDYFPSNMGKASSLLEEIIETTDDSKIKVLAENFGHSLQG